MHHLRHSIPTEAAEPVLDEPSLLAEVQRKPVAGRVVAADRFAESGRMAAMVGSVELLGRQVLVVDIDPADRAAGCRLDLGQTDKSGSDHRNKLGLDRAGKPVEGRRLALDAQAR